MYRSDAEITILEFYKCCADHTTYTELALDVYLNLLILWENTAMPANEQKDEKIDIFPRSKRFANRSLHPIKLENKLINLITKYKQKIRVVCALR
jgi:hypothetical protein